MTFQESAQEIYQSMEQGVSSYLEYCKFVPNIDDITLEKDINSFAKKEEPAEIICTARAKLATGLMKALFGGRSADNFLFTGQTLYVGIHGFKFSDIASITYQEEIKTGLLGGQKKKSYLVVSEAFGENEKYEYEGGLAAESLAQFLDSIVKKNKENPPVKNQQKEFPRSKMIAESLCTANFPEFQTTPNLDEKKINSLIIHFGKSEPKASFIASYKKELFFSNDNLYSSVGEVKKIPYNQLGKAVYEENEKRDSCDNIIMEKKISLLSNDGNVFFENTKELARKDVADFFNKIISDATETEVKTEVYEKKVERKGRELEMYKPVGNIVRNAFKKGSLNLYKHDDDKILRWIPNDEIRDVINELWSIQPRIKASFLYDKIYFGQHYIEYTSISKIVISETTINGQDMVIVNLAFFDTNNKKCCDDKLPLQVAQEIANLVVNIVLEITNKKIEITYDKFFCGGDVVSGDEEKKKKWDLLYGKWNEIFSKDTPIICRGFTESEMERLPTWMKVESKSIYYFIGNAVLEECHGGIWSSEDVVYTYFPEPYSEIEKSLSWIWDNESQLLDLGLMTGDTGFDSASRYTGMKMNKTELDFYYKAFPGKSRPKEGNIDVCEFLRLLDDSSGLNNFLAFRKKLKTVKKNCVEKKKEEEKKEEEEKRKAEADEKKAKEKNMMNDLSNW